MILLHNFCQLNYYNLSNQFAEADEHMRDVNGKVIGMENDNGMKHVPVWLEHPVHVPPIPILIPRVEAVAAIKDRMGPVIYTLPLPAMPTIVWHSRSAWHR